MAVYLRDLAMGFTVGALTVPTLSLSTDRFGSKLGGAFGGLPATVAASTYFLGRAEGVGAAIGAIEVVPIMQGFLGVFLTIYAVIARRGFLRAVAVAGAVWAALVTIPLFVYQPDLWTSVAVLVVLLAGCLWVTERKTVINSTGGRVIKLSSSDIFFRMLAGGSTVAAAIYLGIVSGPVVGGVVACFPAVLLSTLAVLQRTAGAESAAGFAKSVVLSALVNTTVFCAIAYLAYPTVGLAAGTIIGLAATLISGMLCFLAARRWMA